MDDDDSRSLVGRNESIGASLSFHAHSPTCFCHNYTNLVFVSIVCLSFIFFISFLRPLLLFPVTTFILYMLRLKGQSVVLPLLYLIPLFFFSFIIFIVFWTGFFFLFLLRSLSTHTYILPPLITTSHPSPSTVVAPP